MNELDKKFVAFIKKEKDKFVLKQNVIPAETLMAYANQKYEIMVQECTWNAPAGEPEKIVALEAKIAAMVQQQGIVFQEAKVNNRSGKFTKPAWQLVQPQGKAPHTKMVNRKDYHW